MSEVEKDRNQLAKEDQPPTEQPKSAEITSAQKDGFRYDYDDASDVDQ